MGENEEESYWLGGLGGLVCCCSTSFLSCWPLNSTARTRRQSVFYKELACKHCTQCIAERLGNVNSDTVHENTRLDYEEIKTCIRYPEGRNVHGRFQIKTCLFPRSRKTLGNLMFPYMPVFFQGRCCNVCK